MGLAGERFAPVRAFRRLIHTLAGAKACTGTAGRFQSPGNIIAEKNGREKRYPVSTRNFPARAVPLLIKSRK